jgi:hypothetical protein
MRANLLGPSGGDGERTTYGARRDDGERERKRGGGGAGARGEESECERSRCRKGADTVGAGGSATPALTIGRSQGWRDLEGPRSREWLAP